MLKNTLSDSKNKFSSAIEDFYRARNKAKMKEIIARFTGEPTDLLSYDVVRSHLKIQGLSMIGLKDIPVDAIVGSLGRYNDFTRDFLPRKDIIKERIMNFYAYKLFASIGHIFYNNNLFINILLLDS